MTKITTSEWKPFKVGDKVRVIKYPNKNQIGKIGYLDGVTSVDCSVCIDTDILYCMLDEIELVEEQPENNPLKKAWEAYEEEKEIDELFDAIADWEDPQYLQPTRALDSQVGGSHYKDLPIQPVEFILANGLGFCEGSIIKYTCRYRQKGGIEDLKKVIHYAQLLIEDLEKETS